MSKSISYVAINKVTQLLLKLMVEYPEVYLLLDEGPVGIPMDRNNKINDNTLINYAFDIKILIERLDSTHHKQ